MVAGPCYTDGAPPGPIVYNLEHYSVKGGVVVSTPDWKSGNLGLSPSLAHTNP